MTYEKLSLYQNFVIVAFLFFTGGILGWCIELFYRRFVAKSNPERLWLNPGFLTGPWLPIYGFGAAALFMLSVVEVFIVKFDFGGVKHYILMFFMMAIFMTIIEFIAGIIFIQGMHIRLWDYSGEWGNIKGIICPKYTLFWGILSALYYFFLFPPFLNLVIWFTSHPWFSFVVGTFFGLFLVDCGFSFKLGTTLRKKAKEIDKKAAINIQQIHRSARKDKVAKFFSIHNEHYLTSKIDNFENFVRRSPDTINKDKTK